MCIQNLVKFCPFILKILSKNQLLTSIKGHNFVANMQKMRLYNPNVDLVHDNVYTKWSIRSQDIEEKQFLMSIKGRNSVANLRKMMLYNLNIDLVNDNMYTNLS